MSGISKLCEDATKVPFGIAISPERLRKAKNTIRRTNRVLVSPRVGRSIVRTVEEAVCIAENADERGCVLEPTSISSDSSSREAQVTKSSLFDREVGTAQKDLGDELLHLLDELRARDVQPLLGLHVITPIERPISALEQFMPVEPAHLAFCFGPELAGSSGVNWMNSQFHEGADQRLQRFACTCRSKEPWLPRVLEDVTDANRALGSSGSPLPHLLDLGG
jgi:hypothetical protein